MGAACEIALAAILMIAVVLILVINDRQVHLRRPERDRVIVGGFSAEDVGPAATAARYRCAYQTDLLGFVLWGKVGIGRPLPEDLTAAMVPVRKGAMRIVTRGFVRRMHARGKGVFVWTVNRPDEMRHLFDIGVDGLISDYPAVLRRIVEERKAAGLA